MRVLCMTSERRTKCFTESLLLRTLSSGLEARMATNWLAGSYKPSKLMSWQQLNWKPQSLKYFRSGFVSTLLSLNLKLLWKRLEIIVNNFLF